jgi:surfeit locus 1 family protein
MRLLAGFSRRSVLLAAVGLLILAAITLALGNWQVRRAQEKRTLAELREKALASAALELSSQTLSPQRIDGLKARVTGRFEPSGTIFLDNRTFKGQAGFHVLTPLLPEAGGPPLLILRGWVARNVNDSAQFPVVDTPQGPVTVEGLIVARLPQALQLGEPGRPKPGEKIWQYFDLERYSEWLGQSIHPYVLRQISASNDRLIREWMHPADAVDKHRAYALQWYSMTAGIVLFGLFAAFRVVKDSSTKSRVKETV